MITLDITSQVAKMQELIDSQNQHLTEAFKAQIKIQEIYANIEQLIGKP
jgi:hypothetical protein